MASWDARNEQDAPGTYPPVRTPHRSVLLGVLALVAWVALMLWLAAPGYAASWTYDCDPLAADYASCMVLAERLDVLVTEAERQAGLDYLTPLYAIRDNTAATGSPAEVSGTVALSDADRERLDLSWWGTWALVGLIFVLILAPRWFNAFRVTRGG